MESEVTKELAQRFETFIKSAYEQKYEGLPEVVQETMIQFSPILRWDLNRFVDTFLESQQYPADRLRGSLFRLFDVKLQLYYIFEVDIGMYNRLIHDRIEGKLSIADHPHILLTRFSLDQNLIIKSRILWERIMNFVYYLETGNILDDKRSGNKSKKKAFFKLIKDSPKWRFLEPYEQELEEYDNRYRTPEAHKNSILRPEIFGGQPADANDLLKLSNRAINIIWDNILAIISGNQPSYFTDLHLISEHNIDPRYLSNPTIGPDS